MIEFSKPMFGLKGPLWKFRWFSGWQYRTKLVQELFFINELFCLPHKLHVSFAAQIWKPQSIFLYIVTFLGVFGWKFWIGGVSNVVYREHLTRCFYSGPKMVHDKFQRSAWRLISSSTIWGIWLLRNKIVFEEGTINLFDCFSTIIHRVAIWLHTQDSNFTYTGNDLLRSSDGIKLWCNKKS